METTYYSKLDPRRYTSQIKSENQLLNTLASHGEPVTITFTGNTISERIIIRRDTTIIGNVKATFLLVDSAKVKFQNSNVSPVFNKNSGDNLATIQISDSFIGSLTITNSKINAPKSGMYSVSISKQTQPFDIKIDNSQIEGALLISTILTLANNVTILNTSSKNQSILNAGFVVSDNLSLNLSNTKFMHAGTEFKIKELISDYGTNYIEGQFNIDSLIINAKNKKAIEQLHITSSTYQSNITINHLNLTKPIKNTCAIYANNIYICFENSFIENNAPNSRIVIKDSTIDMIDTSDDIIWSVSGESYINVIGNSVSGLAKLLTQFPSNKQSKLIGDDNTSNRLSTDIINTDNLDIDVPDDTYQHNIPKEKSAEDKLNELVELQSVKDKLNAFISNATLDVERKKRGLGSNTSINRHLVFNGNPGTGKTTVARLVAEILHKRGALPTAKVIDVKASSLIADHLGGTATKTLQILESAKDGVLLIDEAYMLNESKASGSFVSEAVETLMTYAEDHRDSIIIILAGYTDKMYELFSTGNPGFKSRFPSSNHIEFPDYTYEDKIEIFKRMLKSNNSIMSEEFIETKKFKSLMNFYSRDKSNARSVRNFIEALLLTRDTRLNTEGDITSLTNEDMMTITAKDIVTVYNRAVELKQMEINSVVNQTYNFAFDGTLIESENSVANSFD